MELTFYQRKRENKQEYNKVDSILEDNCYGEKWSRLRGNRSL